MNYQDTLAKCYVAMSEVNYDLDMWRLEVILSNPDVVAAWNETRMFISDREWKKVGKAC